MKQVTQRLRNGRIEVRDVPVPVLAPQGVLVDVRASLLSAGTERSTVQAARASLLGKARARPEQARQVLEKARRDGIRATLEAVRMRLDQPTGLGYSSAGIVLAVGDRVPDLRPGDRVACAGGGHAVHAEISYVPANLCARLPKSVKFEAGAFATVGSIAIHGVRQSEATLGERVAVIGLGLVGQLACRLLVAAGCDVVGVDLDSALVERVLASGVVGFTREAISTEAIPPHASNCDAVLITAASGSDDPIRLAGLLARDRARVVVLGDVKMDLPRSSFYGKELQLRLSRSYGPGRYDREYEERGLDYPIGYVRWTEQRNLQAFVALLDQGRIAVDDLITGRTPVERAAAAYEQLLVGGGSPLGQILVYEPSSTVAFEPAAGTSERHAARSGRPSTGVIGTGSFAQRVLIPSLRAAGFELSMVASASGLSALGVADRVNGVRTVAPDELLANPDLDVVCIASRHGSHATYARAALEADKAVFVEKPPALTLEQLDLLRTAARGRVLQVGFNRRCAPLAQRMRDYIVRSGHPVELLYRVAAGRLPDGHWTNDPDDGGGRLLGEGCHFVDFACWFVGALPVRVTAVAADGHEQLVQAQRFSISLGFPGGSLATIFYGSEAPPTLEKELVEAHSAQRSAVLHDFRRLELFGDERQTIDGSGQDKGHRAQFISFRRRLDGGAAPTSPDPLDTMAVTLDALTLAGGYISAEPVGA